MTSRERGEAMAAVLMDETKERHGKLCWPGTAHVAAAIALAVDVAVEAERDRIVRQVAGMADCPDVDPDDIEWVAKHIREGKR